MKRVALCLSSLLPLPARADEVVHAVPQADLRVLDPLTTAATITTIYGPAGYDMLFSFDEDDWRTPLSKRFDRQIKEEDSPHLP